MSLSMERFEIEDREPPMLTSSLFALSCVSNSVPSYQLMVPLHILEVVVEAPLDKPTRDCHAKQIRNNVTG